MKFFKHSRATLAIIHLLHKTTSGIASPVQRRLEFCDELGEEWPEFCEVAKVEVFTYLDLTSLYAVLRTSTTSQRPQRQSQYRSAQFVVSRPRRGASRDA